jgi:hypothetical protein
MHSRKYEQPACLASDINLPEQRHGRLPIGVVVVIRRPLRDRSRHLASTGICRFRRPYLWPWADPRNSDGVNPDGELATLQDQLSGYRLTPGTAGTPTA